MCKNSYFFEDFGLKIMAPMCSALIFTPRECVSVKFSALFYFGLGGHVYINKEGGQLPRDYMLSIKKKGRHLIFWLGYIALRFGTPRLYES